MGDERRTDTVKEAPVAGAAGRPKQPAGDDTDTSHADHQLARGNPVGFNDESIDHAFKGVGDQREASREMKSMLDAGVPVTGLVEKVQKLDAGRRDEVAKRIRDVASVACGNGVMQFAD